MRAVIVYESVYGNTHTEAEHIARGLASAAGPIADEGTVVVPVGGATPAVVASADLLIVGGPTHIHGMSWSRTRHMAVTAAEREGKGAIVDPDADGPGLRDWTKGLGHVSGNWAVAFDTRVEGSPRLTGRASSEISHRLRDHGYRELAPPESFLVDKENHLLPGEAERARTWGAELGRAYAAATAAST